MFVAWIMWRRSYIYRSDYLDNATSEESATICQGESYTLPDGETASFSGSFTSILEAANGCDSIITTELTVINLNSTIILSNGVLSSNQPSSGATI